MNIAEIKVSWNGQKSKLKKKYTYIAENDLMFEKGKNEEMYGKLKIKLSKTNEKLRKIINGL